MRVDADQHPREFWAPLFAPHTTIAQKETLLRSVAVNVLRSLASFVFGNHLFKGHQGNAGPAVIGRILPQSKLAVQFQVIDRDKVPVFTGHTTGALFEFFPILFGPPVAKIALRIELAALIIEAVGKFMADHRTDAAKVDRIVHFLVEKRRL